MKPAEFMRSQYRRRQRSPRPLGPPRNSEGARCQSETRGRVRSRPDRRAYSGFTGAHLANRVNETAIVATRRKGDAVTLDDFTAAIERLVAGLEKKSRVLSPEERRRVACHEMGHAPVAATPLRRQPCPQSINHSARCWSAALHDATAYTGSLLIGAPRSRQPHRRAHGGTGRGGADFRWRGLDGRVRRPAAGNRDRYQNGHALWHGRDATNNIEASDATEREIDIAVRDIVAKALDRASKVLRARRADLDEGVRLLLAREARHFRAQYELIFKSRYPCALEALSCGRDLG